MLSDGCNFHTLSYKHRYLSVYSPNPNWEFLYLPAAKNFTQINIVVAHIILMA
jgi:hypothetical protein